MEKIALMQANVDKKKEMDKNNEEKGSSLLNHGIRDSDKRENELPPNK